MELYRSLDYWQCRELLNIANNGRMNPEAKLQSSENNAFNQFLDTYSYRKFEWFSLGAMNLWQIKNKTVELLHGEFISEPGKEHSKSG